MVVSGDEPNEDPSPRPLGIGQLRILSSAVHNVQKKNIDDQPDVDYKEINCDPYRAANPPTPNEIRHGAERKALDDCAARDAVAAALGVIDPSPPSPTSSTGGTGTPSPEDENSDTETQSNTDTFLCGNQKNSNDLPLPPSDVHSSLTPEAVQKFAVGAERLATALPELTGSALQIVDLVGALRKILGDKFAIDLGRIATRSDLEDLKAALTREGKGFEYVRRELGRINQTFVRHFDALRGRLERFQGLRDDFKKQTLEYENLKGAQIKFRKALFDEYTQFDDTCADNKHVTEFAGAVCETYNLNDESGSGVQYAHDSWLRGDNEQIIQTISTLNRNQRIARGRLECEIAGLIERNKFLKDDNAILYSRIDDADANSLGLKADLARLRELLVAYRRDYHKAHLEAARAKAQRTAVKKLLDSTSLKLFNEQVPQLNAEVNDRYRGGAELLGYTLPRSASPQSPSSTLAAPGTPTISHTRPPSISPRAPLPRSATQPDFFAGAASGWNTTRAGSTPFHSDISSSPSPPALVDTDSDIGICDPDSDSPLPDLPPLVGRTRGRSESFDEALNANDWNTSHPPKKRQRFRV